MNFFVEIYIFKGSYLFLYTVPVLRNKIYLGVDSWYIDLLILEWGS